MTATDAVLVDDVGRVRVLTLNRPERLNAIDDELHDNLLAALAPAKEDGGPRSIVLTGAGDAFSSGGDLDLIRRMRGDPGLRQATLDTGRALFLELTSLRIPVVAAVNGPAVGAGCTLALLCDIVVMSADAYLADPHVRVGLVPGDGGAVLWPLLAGLGTAKAYLLTGDRLPAEEAHRLGLVHQVVDGDPMVMAVALAERIAARPPAAVQETKAALNMHIRARDDVLAYGLDAEYRSFDDPEHRESIT